MSVQNIIDTFELLIAKVFALEEKGAAFKAREYKDVMKALRESGKKTLAPEEVEPLLVAYGKKNPKKSVQKIIEIIETGSLSAVEKARSNPQVMAVQNLTQIYGVGHKKAIQLYKIHQVVSVEDLRRLHKTTPKCINSKQAIGLEYFDDLQQRIPRTEMRAYAACFQAAAAKVSESIQLSINGSYRRRCPTSGDIDVLVTTSESTKDASVLRQQFITTLQQQGVIVETLANGKKKFMGVCRLLPEYSTHRHIDIIDTTPEQFPFSTLYFTGSGPFNAKMRAQALERGYSLNEFQLSHKSTKRRVTPEEIKQRIGESSFRTEKDIFDFLGLDYVEPWERT